MRTERFAALFLAVFFSLPALSISYCNDGSILHYFKDNYERCCQNVTVPSGHERRICKEENGKAEYEQCPPRTYQSSNYSSHFDISCKAHSECLKPNLVVAVPGNSISDNLCECNEAEGYKARNVPVGTVTLEAYHCLLDRSYESQKGISYVANITSKTTGYSEYTTESPSTEAAETVGRPIKKYIGIAVAIGFTAVAFVVLFFFLKKRKLIISACQRFRRNQGRQNGAQTTLDIEAAVDEANVPLDNRSEPTHRREEGDAVGNGHVTSNGTCLRSARLSAGLSDTDEPQNAVGNGHVTSNGDCWHSTPSSAGLSETDEQRFLIDLRPDGDRHEDVRSSLCEEPNT